MIAVSPATIATRIQRHWGIENAFHRVRDLVFDVYRHQLRTGNGPQVVATLRNTAIGLLRPARHNQDRDRVTTPGPEHRPPDRTSAPGMVALSHARAAGPQSSPPRTTP